MQLERSPSTAELLVAATRAQSDEGAAKAEVDRLSKRRAELESVKPPEGVDEIGLRSQARATDERIAIFDCKVKTRAPS